MRRRTTTFAVLAPLAFTVWAAGSAAATPDNADTSAGPSVRATDGQALPKIRGTVGPGFTIDINKRSVPAGKYKFIVQDNSSTMHNFHLTGQGVDERTTVPFEGRAVWRVDLTEGTYKAVCDPHRDDMKTKLQVTA